MSKDQDGFQHFHFTLGPVQGFVAQARRTRDFWAGSFILSWLSAVAAKAVLAQHKDNEILFPKVNEDFLGWLVGDERGERPIQGGNPNRFQAMVHAESFKPELVVETLRKAWQALADEVWKNDLEDLSDDLTRAVWDRQIKGINDAESFWEIAWVLLEAGEDDPSCLDQRKNWRSHFPPDEPGVKCMMMDGWQELSGAESPTKSGGVRLKEFWQRVREKGRKGMKTDLRPGEHLCAIGFVKRRFVRWFKGLDVEMPGGWQLKGWELKPGTPSTPFMAAVHWLEKVLELTVQDTEIERRFLQFHRAAHELATDYGAWDSRIRCLEEQTGQRRWKALDGDLFFETSLDNENLYGGKGDPRRPLADATKDRLKALQAVLPFSAPTPFYAVLMMDGDSLGEKMGEERNRDIITQALDTFTKAVKEIVDRHSGFLIYAGGDDVLAVLPLEDAMDCALALRECYLQAFESSRQARIAAGKWLADEAFEASLSGAIEYAHTQMPLTKVLKDAHELLDQVAKDGRGRDALAVRVWKPGGKALEWAMPWERALEDDPSEPGKRRLVLARLVEELRSDDNRGELSSGFFYRIRERFDLLNPGPGSTEPILDPGKDDINLMAVDYYASGLCDQNFKPAQRMLHARAVVEPLLKQCRPVYREAGKQPDQWPSDANLFADGALLVRFLAQKGVKS